ncbi:MAG: signal peptidase I [bacterium]
MKIKLFPLFTSQRLIKSFSAFRILSIGVFIFAFKLLFLLAFFPLYLIYKIANIGELISRIKKEKFKISFLKPKSFRSFIGRLVAVIAISITFLPIWVGGYALVGSLVAEQLGYVTEDINIVGTGSMYPTWPKGTKGKDPKELAKEVISTAGFLPYPNGLVIGGKRVFGHSLNRGDIIIWENDATRALTSQDSGEPAGLLKRLIGLPGDTIELRDGIVYLNGEPQKEPYIAKSRSTFGEKFLKECQVVTVPNGEVFAMGDNRKGSADSREIGFAPIKDMDRVLPLSKQKGTLDKNWHDASDDLNNFAKPKIDKSKFVELLNEKRKEKGAVALKHQPKLEKSASLRGETILKYNDFEQKSSYTMEKSMADAGYWNTYWWEVSIQGYYEAEELIEDYLERDWTDAKETWFDKKFDDIGVAEVGGELNGCPTQVIVIHVAGYVPATYDKEVVDSWRASVDNLNSIIPSWEAIEGKGWVNEEELNRLLNLLNQERTIASRILSKMEARQWLTKEDDNLINNYNEMVDESSSLANKLNQR